jgi:hypothetical protein
LFLHITMSSAEIKRAWQVSSDAFGTERDWPLAGKNHNFSVL